MSHKQARERDRSKAGGRAYKPTLKERAALEAQAARKQARPPGPRMKAFGKDLTPDHEDCGYAMLLLMNALGTTDLDFVSGLISQLCNVGSQGPEIDEAGLNFMLSVVKGAEPKDEVESMLAAQMAAVHLATMTFARRLAHVENIRQQDSAERAFNKLARTFTAQVEALRRYRTGGEQKLTVEHVHIHEGGQAIVGNVNSRGGGVMPENEELSHAKSLTHAPGAHAALPRRGKGRLASLQR